MSQQDSKSNRLPHDADDSTILAFVRDWASRLAEQDYPGAMAMIPPNLAHDPVMTPEILSALIRNYGSLEPYPDGATFKVTPWTEAGGDSEPQHEVDWDETRGWVWFDLPLNGEWSDLTATFDLHRHADQIEIILDSVHVH